MKTKSILTFIIGAAVGTIVGYAISENDQWNCFMRDMTQKLSKENCDDECCGKSCDKCDGENCGHMIDKEIAEDFEQKQAETQDATVDTSKSEQ